MIETMIDKAIKHAEEVAIQNTKGLEDAIALGGQNPTREEIEECEKCAAEHRQLAEWLKELKQYRENRTSSPSTEMRGCSDCIIIREYLSKCEQYGCDSCVAETYCILNNLRTDRYPGEMCEKNMLEYLDSRKEIHNNISSTVSSTDAVSREAVFHELDSHHWESREDWAIISDAIDCLPSVTPDAVSMEVIEAIKEEIKSEIGKDGFPEWLEGYNDGLQYALDVIDRHIGKENHEEHR